MGFKIKKIGIILGTRPEIIKLGPIIKKCQNLGLNFFQIHTGQHYSFEMDKIFYKNLGLPQPEYNLEVGSGKQGQQTGRMLEKIENVLIKEKPDIILVQGDTNSVLAGALAAKKLDIKVGHIEAGLRSYDSKMPEEINRIITDHISDFLFVPTQKSYHILIKEGINKNKIYLTGNTIVDAVQENISIAKKNKNILKSLNLDKKEYILITAHRPSNVDNKKNLEKLIEILNCIIENFNIKIVFPIHPRTKKMIELYNLDLPKNLKLINPIGYLDFLQLQNSAKVILTDSGGIQEEACILKIPCITLRENTERPETIEVGSNLLTGLNKEKIILALGSLLNKKNQWDIPFGDGTASSKIIKICNNS